MKDFYRRTFGVIVTRTNAERKKWLEEVKKIIEEYFYYPRKYPATYLIAKEVCKLYYDNDDFFRKKRVELFKFKKIKDSFFLAGKNIKGLLGMYEENLCFSIDDKKHLKEFWNKKIFSEKLFREIR